MNASLARTLAEAHSASCFLNSFLREWPGHSIEGGVLTIELPDSPPVRIPLKHRSAVGRHEYDCDGSWSWGDRNIGFTELADGICATLSRAFGSDEARSRKFRARIERSVESIALSIRERAPEIEKLHSLAPPAETLDFLSSEQGLVIGHSFHPSPKSRDEFTEADLRRYSPELGGRFGLHWFMVRPEALVDERSSPFERTDWLQAAFEDEARGLDSGLASRASELRARGWIPFPVHPWQREHILRLPEVRSHLSEGRLIDLGESELSWHPTSSLRTLFRPDAAYMLKFSMSVRLTNSVRHLLPREVARGIEVHQVFSTAPGRELQAAYPRFRMIFEPAYAALKGESGPLIETIVVCRENPFRGEAARGKAMLATLAQDDPMSPGGGSLIEKLAAAHASSTGLAPAAAARAWFGRYLDLVVEPLMIAQARYGILLGAHQQNLILGFEGGSSLPESAYFRDCQGTGYSPRGYSLFAGEVPMLSERNGNVLNDLKGSHLFSYYAIINSTFNVIAALGRASGIDGILLDDLRERLSTIASSLPETDACLDYLLRSPELLQKGNFLCSFTHQNENVTDNPLSIYNPMPNPILARNQEPQ